MDASSKDSASSSHPSDQDGKSKPSSEEGASKQEARTKQNSVGDRGASMESIEYDGDEYDDYGDFDLITSASGFGSGGGGTKRDQKRKEKGSAANIYSSKHTRMRAARKGHGK